MLFSHENSKITPFFFRSFTPFLRVSIIQKFQIKYSLPSHSLVLCKGTLERIPNSGKIMQRNKFWKVGEDRKLPESSAQEPSGSSQFLMSLGSLYAEQQGYPGIFGFYIPPISGDLPSINVKSPSLTTGICQAGSICFMSTLNSTRIRCSEDTKKLDPVTK